MDPTGDISRMHIWHAESSDNNPSMGFNQPFEKLLDFSGAFLNSDAVDFNLNHALLIKGPPGTGKATLAHEVARNLGIHLFEVSINSLPWVLRSWTNLIQINCYNLIGDTEVQTEGNLRARFEKANSCSPCIFLLRHVDALAQTSQVQESDKGEMRYVCSAHSDCSTLLQNLW